MKKTYLGLIIATALSSYSSAFVLINEDFESATAGDSTSGANGNLTNTTLRTRNNPGSFVAGIGGAPDTGSQAITVVTSGSVPGFTSATGNVARLSISAGSTAAAFSATPAVINLTGGTFDASATYTISFDLFIPDAIPAGQGVGRVQARLSGRTSNPTLSSQSQTAPGVYAISYTGTLADFAQGPTASTTAEPFFSFSQNSSALADDEVAYIDNVFFEITPVPEPSVAILGLLGTVGFLRRRR